MLDLRPFLKAIEINSDIGLKQSLFAKLGSTLSILNLNFPSYTDLNQKVYPPALTRFAFAGSLKLQRGYDFGFQWIYFASKRWVMCKSN